jgi:hypothetical protein
LVQRLGLGVAPQREEHVRKVVEARGNGSVIGSECAFANR